MAHHRLLPCSAVWDILHAADDSHTSYLQTGIVFSSIIVSHFHNLESLRKGEIILKKQGNREYILEKFLISKYLTRTSGSYLFFPGLMDHCRRGHRQIIRAIVVDDYTVTVFSGHNRAVAHMNS